MSGDALKVKCVIFLMVKTILYSNLVHTENYKTSLIPSKSVNTHCKKETVKKKNRTKTNKGNMMA